MVYTMILGVPWYILVLPVWLVLMVVGIKYLTRRIHLFLWGIVHLIPFRRLADFVLHVIVLPGILAHEVCHALMAQAAGARMTPVSVYPCFKIEGDRAELEFGVTTLDPREVDLAFLGLVGIAPLLLGNVALTLLLLYGFGIPISVLFEHPAYIIRTLPHVLSLILARRSPFLLFLLIWAAFAMTPSPADWPRGWKGIATLGAITVSLQTLLALALALFPESRIVDSVLRLVHLLSVQLAVVCLANLPVFLILLFPGQLAAKTYVLRELRRAGRI